VSASGHDLLSGPSELVEPGLGLEVANRRNGAVGLRRSGRGKVFDRNPGPEQQGLPDVNCIHPNVLPGPGQPDR